MINSDSEEVPDLRFALSENFQHISSSSSLLENDWIIGIPENPFTLLVPQNHWIIDHLHDSCSYDRIIKMMEVRLFVEWNSLVQQLQHHLWLQTVSHLHHERHWVGSGCHQGQQRMTLIACHLEHQACQNSENYPFPLLCWCVIFSPYSKRLQDTMIRKMKNFYEKLQQNFCCSCLQFVCCCKLHWKLLKM